MLGVRSVLIWEETHFSAGDDTLRLDSLDRLSRDDSSKVRL